MPANVEAKEPSAMGPGDTVTDRAHLGAGPRALAAVGALVVVGVLVAGCGGGAKSPGVANVTTSSTTSSHTSSSSTANSGTALSGGGPSSGSGTGAPRSGFAIATGNPQKALKLS